MEVHHHPHAGKKSFKEYFLEFLMIFLAVTLGFFAEGLREHIGNKAKEKEYLSSLVTELKYDTAQYHIMLSKILNLRPILDSMYINARQAARFNYLLQARWNTPVNVTSLEYMPALPTIQQLKNTGNLRLIKNKQIVNKITLYETFVQNDLRRMNDFITGSVRKVYSYEDEICNYIDFSTALDKNFENMKSGTDLAGTSLYPMPLVVRDTIRLNELANSFINYKATSYFYYKSIKKGIQIATELLQMIDAEYRME